MALLNDLAYSALRVAGVIDRARRNPPSEILNEVLEIFNRMVGSWNNIKLNIFQELIVQETLTGNQQTYTIGPGASNFNAMRPAYIERANLFITSNPSIVRRPINILQPADWGAKRVQNIAGPPLDLYDDYASPISTLYFWPIPDQNYPFELYTWQQIPTATALGNQIQLPPGYDEAIVYNLARRIATQFPGQASLSADALKIARNALDAIESRNTRSPRMVNDAAGLGSGKGPRADFNWLTGTVN